VIHLNIKQIEVRNYVTKSKLPDADYVINPYIGCPHACMYCYASYMKRFTNHSEDWGCFLDVKRAIEPIDLDKIKDKTVVISSVTDCYNEYEEKYEVTKNILEQLIHADSKIQVITKSDLILRDIELLKQIKNLTVIISLNTTDENFKNDMDKAPSIKKRISTLKSLKQHQIKTVLFMSPIFPYISDFKALIEQTRPYVDEYWFENLNLRGSYKKDVLEYIKDKHPQLYVDYVNIFVYKDKTYWENLSKEINDYCLANNINYKDYFYHEELVK
jgi:DNA repair photolyase